MEEVGGGGGGAGARGRRCLLLRLADREAEMKEVGGSGAEQAARGREGKRKEWKDASSRALCLQFCAARRTPPVGQLTRGAQDGRLGWSWAADRTAWTTLDAATIIARHFVRRQSVKGRNRSLHRKESDGIFIRESE